MQKNLCCILEPTINKKCLLTTYFFRDNPCILTVLILSTPVVIPSPPIYKISPPFNRTPGTDDLLKGALPPLVIIIIYSFYSLRGLHISKSSDQHMILKDFNSV